MPACCQAGNGLKWSYSFVTSGTSVTAAEYQGYPVCRYGGQSAHQWRLVRLEPKLNVRFYSKILIVIEFIPFYGGRHVVVIISCIGNKKRKSLLFIAPTAVVIVRFQLQFQLRFQLQQFRE